VALVRQQLFVYRDLWVWLDDPFQAPPALAGMPNWSWDSRPRQFGQQQTMSIFQTQQTGSF
jgi:hypothetical protein